MKFIMLFLQAMWTSLAKSLVLAAHKTTAYGGLDVFSAPSHYCRTFGGLMIYQVLPQALTSQQAPCWTPPGCTAESAPCLQWGPGLLSSSVAQGVSIHLCSDTITVLSHINQRFSSLFHAPARTMIKEPPPTLHFPLLARYIPFPKT